jgi:hypothetical protein
MRQEILATGDATRGQLDWAEAHITVRSAIAEADPQKRYFYIGADNQDVLD